MHRNVCLILAVVALPLATEAGPISQSAAQQWQTVKNLGKPHTFAWPPHTDASAVAQARKQAIAAYVKDADTLRSFYQAFPGDPNVHEAKRLEALSLLYASQVGDTTDAARCAALVADVRTDPSLPTVEREPVAALSDNMAVAAQHISTRADRLLALEKTARNLQNEFPDVVLPYLSLVQLAKASDDNRAAIIAADVLKMPAPDTLKAQAQIILDRLALKGTSIDDVAALALGNGNPISKVSQVPIVVYSWSASSPASLALAKHLSTVVPPAVAIFGVCLDIGDLTASKAAASSAQIPGTQIYDPLGRMGRLAGRLRLFDPGTVYLADSSGRITSVSAQLDLTTALAQINNP